MKKKHLKGIEEDKKLQFLLSKKPITYKISSKAKLKFLIKRFCSSQRNYKIYKAKNGIVRLKVRKKLKIRFRNLITWMHLKTTRNGASFNEYKKFIEQNNDYPRINEADI